MLKLQLTLNEFQCLCQQKCSEHRVLVRCAKLHSLRTIPPDNYQASRSDVMSAHHNTTTPTVKQYNIMHASALAPVGLFHAETRNVIGKLESHTLTLK